MIDAGAVSNAAQAAQVLNNADPWVPVFLAGLQLLSAILLPFVGFIIWKLEKNTTKLEKNTNSMKDALVALNRALGQKEGREELLKELAMKELLHASAKDKLLEEALREDKRLLSSVPSAGVVVHINESAGSHESDNLQSSQTIPKPPVK